MDEQDQDVQQTIRSLRDAEMERKRFGMCIRVLLCAAVIAGAGMALKRVPGLERYWFVGPLLLTFGAGWLLKLPWNEYREAYKNACVSSALSGLFTDLDYDQYGGISEMAISETGLIYMGDSVFIEDSIRGRYNDVYLERSDVHIQEKRQQRRYDSRGSYDCHTGRTRTANVTIFRGRWLVYDFKKTFRGDVQIVQKGFRCAGQRTGMGTVFSRTGMELDSGNSHFRIYMKNVSDVFSIGSSLMEQVQKLADSVKGKLMIGMIGSELHVVIDDNGRSLEPPLNVFLPIREDRVVRQVRGEMDSITQFIDKLRLVNDLFIQED